MSNLFDRAAQKLKGSSFVLQVMFIAALMLACSFVLMWEDTVSSRNGFELLEIVYGIKPANYAFVYWVISIVPQIGQIGFVYLYAMDTRRKWALGVAAMFFLIDLIADVQDRSNGHLFAFSANGVDFNLDAKTAVSAGISIGWYTVGSELFFTAGGGLLLAAFPDAVDAWTGLNIRIRSALANAELKMKQSQERINQAKKRQDVNGQNANLQPQRTSARPARHQQWPQ